MELLKGLDFGHLRHRDRDNVGRHATANTGGSWSAQYRYKYTTSTWQTAALTLTLILGIEANWLQRNEALNKHKPPSSLETSVPEEVGLITRYRLIYKQPPSNQNHKREHESGELRIAVTDRQHLKLLVYVKPESWPETEVRCQIAKRQTGGGQSFCPPPDGSKALRAGDLRDLC
ncbi:hypothetical protein NCU16361 [Neurospora crassa OR74A]|uniref:Uncharacterized protein n=1 Tax=Neurospora crassa (strain ATCC 24698 / 74-OR23-1A / CBS 708.71 / DSM 1257 / FGSC 987) TaxID=367110 RepID=V5IP28_NEUCR|nr:hypothetical protein NCU16361 [Neurospora crassa OR74A]ESA43898.1 hypothetical protein NCU16361 [Neurospora crassa OR74A]|eukprot:XP_011393357.1 hypothetical protein NCU16361 [Neurospora crassa OR74A]